MFGLDLISAASTIVVALAFQRDGVDAVTRIILIVAGLTQAR